MAEKIEKVSKYIIVDQKRHVLLSLPKLKWLESQPDYVPWPPLEEPKEEAVKDYEPTRYVSRPKARSAELTDRQKGAWELHLEGKTNKFIAESFDTTTNAVSKLLSQAREKLGIGLGEHEVSDDQKRSKQSRHL